MTNKTAETLYRLAEVADVRLSATIAARTDRKRDRRTMTAADLLVPEVRDALREKLNADEAWLTYLRTSRVKAVLAAVVVCLGLAMPASADPLKWALPALAVGHVGDGITTTMALRLGAVELNPFLPQSPRWNAPTQAVYATAGIVALRRLGKAHPRLATWLAVAGIAAETASTIHNIGTIREMRAAQRQR